MKKIFTAILITLFLALPSLGLCAGSVTESAIEYTRGEALVVTLTCVGDAADGSVPDTDLSDGVIEKLKGRYYLYTVTAYPADGGTAPDAADITVTDKAGADLLGGKGTNLIHATDKQATFPYNTYNSSFWYPMVDGDISVEVANQGTASADYIIELVFVR